MTKKSLTELLNDTTPAPLPRTTMTATLVEGQHILDEIKQLQQRFTDLLASGPGGAVSDTGERTGPPAKAGQKSSDARVESLEADIRSAFARLADFQVTLGFTGIQGGEWQTWKDEHPPRPDNVTDQQVALGWCNATDLLDDLGRYVTSWDGDQLEPGQWDQLAEKVVYADRRDAVHEVVKMFEARVNPVPFSLSGSSTTDSSATD